MISTLAFIFALAQAVGPSIALDAPAVLQAAPGEAVAFTVRVELPASDSGAKVRLHPLALTNLRLGRIESGVIALQNAEDSAVSRWFRVTLLAEEAGAATLGPVEVEVDKGGERPLVLSAQGFDLRVVAPFDWGSLLEWWPWAVGALLLIAVGIFLIIRYAPSAVQADDPTAERERAVIEDLDDRLRRADFRGAVDIAYGLLAKAEGTETLNRINSDDLRAARRLGEETRYAGYSPDRGEAAFIVKLARATLAAAKGQSKGTGKS